MTASESKGRFFYLTNRFESRSGMLYTPLPAVSFYINKSSKLTSVCLCCKSHCCETANSEILSAHFKHRSQLPHLYQSVAYRNYVNANFCAYNVWIQL